VALENSLSRFGMKRLDTAKPWTSFFFAEQPCWPSSIRKQVWSTPVLRHVEGLPGPAKLAPSLAMRAAGKSAFRYSALRAVVKPYSIKTSIR
jgi:hypothetical protein